MPSWCPYWRGFASTSPRCSSAPTSSARLQFEADILNHSTVDLAIKLPLTERVTVTVDGSGYLVEHHDEPVNEYDDPATWRPSPQ